MNFENIVTDYYQELAMLYKDKIDSDPTLFDSDRYMHGYNCPCCSRCFDDPSRNCRK